MRDGKSGKWRNGGRRRGKGGCACAPSSQTTAPTKLVLPGAFLFIISGIKTKHIFLRLMADFNDKITNAGIFGCTLFVQTNCTILIRGNNDI